MITEPYDMVWSEFTKYVHEAKTNGIAETLYDVFKLGFERGSIATVHSIM